MAAKDQSGALRFLKEVYGRTDGIDVKTGEAILVWEVVKEKVYVLELSTICEGKGTCGASFDQQVGGIQFRSGFELALSPEAEMPLQYHRHSTESPNKSPEILRVLWGSVYLHTVDEESRPIRVLLRGGLAQYHVAIVGDSPHFLQPGRERPVTCIRECFRHLFNSHEDRKVDCWPELAQQETLAPRSHFRALALLFR